MRQRDANDFTQDRDAWEISVFKEATYISVAWRVDRGQYDRQEFPVEKFDEAWTLAATPSPKGGNRLIYACNADGRQVCLERANQDVWFALWYQRFPEKAPANVKPDEVLERARKRNKASPTSLSRQPTQS